jgi:hypothetical protein
LRENYNLVRFFVPPSEKQGNITFFEPTGSMFNWDDYLDAIHALNDGSGFYPAFKGETTGKIRNDSDYAIEWSNGLFRIINSITTFDK